MENTVERPSDEAKPRAVTFKLPLDQTNNLADIGVMNAVNWAGKRFNYDMTIEFVSYETQKAITEATIAAIPAAADLAEVVADRVTNQLVNHDVGQLPEVQSPPQIIDFPTAGEAQVSPDIQNVWNWSEKRLDDALDQSWEPIPESRCYNAKQTADKLGIPVRSLHCDDTLKEALGVQQNGKNHKLLFPKCKVNAYRKAMIEAKKKA